MHPWTCNHGDQILTTASVKGGTAGPAPGAFSSSLSFFISWSWRSTSRAGFCCPRLRLSSLGSEQSHLEGSFLQRNCVGSVSPGRLCLSNSGLALEAVGGGKTRSGAALQMLKGTEATQSEVPAVAVSGRCRDQPAPRPGKGNTSDRLKVTMEEQMAVQLPWWRDPEYDDRTVDLQRCPTPIHPEDPWLHLQSNLPQT
ncbi:unnamed protein product [Arctogadus glacialis]